MPSHARSVSHADAPSTLHDNRRSLQFQLPVSIQPASAPGSARPASLVGASPVRSRHGRPSPASRPPDFTELATQERRVLELKEELAKAEEKLKQLKQDWADQEACRLFHPQPLHATLHSPGVSDHDPYGPGPTPKEMEHTIVAYNLQRKPPARTVFSGSRHIRAISLLSPDNTSVRQPLPHDASVRTGRQMADDFKDGLRTFFEDLRQATVGDEAVNDHAVCSRRGQATESPRRSSQPKARRLQQPSCNSSPLVDFETGLWCDHLLDTPTSAATTRPRLRRGSSQGSREIRDRWDLPTDDEALLPSHSSTNTSVSDGDVSHPSDAYSPRTSTRHAKENPPKTIVTSCFADSFGRSSALGPTHLELDKPRTEKRPSSTAASPWQTLSKLTPIYFKNAAFSLMGEFERSISSPTEGSLQEAEDLQAYIDSISPTKISKAE